MVLTSNDSSVIVIFVTLAAKIVWKNTEGLLMKEVFSKNSNLGAGFEIIDFEGIVFKELLFEK